MGTGISVQGYEMKYQKPQLTYDELAAALMKTNAELKEMEQSRSEFYANISHDLRSPLAALKSSVEYLQSLDNRQALMDEFER